MVANSELKTFETQFVERMTANMTELSNEIRNLREDMVIRITESTERTRLIFEADRAELIQKILEGIEATVLMKAQIKSLEAKISGQ